MGLKLSNLNKKLFICSLGIIILTYGICYYYKKQTLKEGISGEMVPDVIMGNLASSIPQTVISTSVLGTQAAADTAAMTALNANIFGAEMANAEGVAAAQESSAAAKNMVQLAKTESSKSLIVADAKSNTALTGMEIASGTAVDTAATAQSEVVVTTTNTIHATAQKMIDRARAIINKMSYFRMFAYLGIIYQWGLPFIQCGWYWFVNIKQCFFWYLLDTIGQILYLPFGILLWIFPILQPPSDLFWNTLDDLDCLCFDATGFHFLHYSPTIIKNCYSCSPTEFPTFDMSNLFQVI
jgi:hypothetical protein